MTRAHHADAEKPTLVDSGVAETNPAFAGAVLTVGDVEVAAAVLEQLERVAVSFSMCTGAPGIERDDARRIPESRDWQAAN